MSNDLKQALFIFVVGVIAVVIGGCFIAAIHNPNTIVNFRDYVDAILSIGAGVLLISFSLYWVFHERHKKNV